MIEKIVEAVMQISLWRIWGCSKKVKS